jgi:hypothetical protein
LEKYSPAAYLKPKLVTNKIIESILQSERGKNKGGVITRCLLGAMVKKLHPAIKKWNKTGPEMLKKTRGRDKIDNHSLLLDE